MKHIDPINFLFFIPFCWLVVILLFIFAAPADPMPEECIHDYEYKGIRHLYRECVGKDEANWWQCKKCKRVKSEFLW